MIINFKTREINQDTRKLTQTLTLINKKTLYHTKNNS